MGQVPWGADFEMENYMQVDYWGLLLDMAPVSVSE